MILITMEALIWWCQILKKHEKNIDVENNAISDKNKTRLTRSNLDHDSEDNESHKQNKISYAEVVKGKMR